MMEDYHTCSDAVLLSLEKKYRAEAKILLQKAQYCLGIRISRSALMMLNEAERAKQRALTGTCHCPKQDCPVHQMGGKEGYEASCR